MSAHRALLTTLGFLHCAVCTFAQAADLTHGPILGRPQHDSMRVWVRTSRPATFRVRYDRKPDLDKGSPSVTSHTTAAADNTGYADLTGLTGAKTYWYAIELDSKIIRGFQGDGKPLSFRTWPSERSFHHPLLNPQGLANTTIAVAVCNHINNARQSAVYRNILERHWDALDLIVMNGDYIYENTRKKVKARDITVEHARTDYCLQLEGVPDMARLFARTPVLFQFDDHEIGPEQSTADIGWKISDKVRNHYTNPLLRDITLPAWMEYCGWANPPMPAYRPILSGRAQFTEGDPILHDPTADFSSVTLANTSSLHIHSQANNGGVYAVEEVVDAQRLRLRPAPMHSEASASYSVGTRFYYDLRKGNTHLFVLDTRGERGTYRPGDEKNPEVKVLGDAQKAWLLDGVRRSDADFIVIISPVPWTIWHNDSHMKGRALLPGEADKEDGIIGALAERDPLIDAFDAIGKPVVIMTGDLHTGYGVQITRRVWEFLVSPVASDLHPFESGGNPPVQGLFDSNGRQVNIKWASGFPLSHTQEFRAQGRRHGFVYALLKVNNIYPAGQDETGRTLWQAYTTPTLRLEVRDTETDEVVYAETLSKAVLE